MSFFGTSGAAGRNRPPPPAIKKVVRTIPKPVIKAQAPAPSPRALAVPRKTSTPRRDEPKERVKRLAVKRKSHTPSPAMSSGEDTDGEDSARSLTPNKRPRPDAAPVDLDRRIIDLKNRSRRDEGRFKFVHGADLVTGEAGRKYLRVFEELEKPAKIELQYPSDSQRERYV